MSHKFITLWILLIALILICGTVSAQEATPQPIPPPAVVISDNPAGDTVVTSDAPVTIIRDENPVLLGALILAALLIGFLILERRQLTKIAADAIPQPIAELLLKNRIDINADLDKGLEPIQSAVLATTNTLDDMLLQYSREGAHGILDALFDAIEQRESAPPNPPAATP